MACAPLAEALLQAGDLAGAKDAAERAIAFSRRSLRATYEAWAQGILARALLRLEGSDAREAAEAALAATEALIERNGIALLAPALCEWRAELAAVLGDEGARAQLIEDAYQGYLAVGAPARAERMRERTG